jgi:hypothetical protein
VQSEFWDRHACPSFFMQPERRSGACHALVIKIHLHKHEEFFIPSRKYRVMRGRFD